MAMFVISRWKKILHQKKFDALTASQWGEWRNRSQKWPWVRKTPPSSMARQVAGNGWNGWEEIDRDLQILEILHLEWLKLFHDLDIYSRTIIYQPFIVDQCLYIYYIYSGWWWLEHDWIIFHFIKKGCHPKPIDELTPSFFRGVGWNHQPVIVSLYIFMLVVFMLFAFLFFRRSMLESLRSSWCYENICFFVRKLYVQTRIHIYDIHPEENGIRTFKHTLTEMVLWKKQHFSSGSSWLPIAPNTSWEVPGLVNCCILRTKKRSTMRTENG